MIDLKRISDLYKMIHNSSQLYYFGVCKGVNSFGKQ